MKGQRGSPGLKGEMGLPGFPGRDGSVGQRVSALLYLSKTNIQPLLASYNLNVNKTSTLELKNTFLS